MKFRYPVINLLMVLAMVLSAFGGAHTPAKAAVYIGITTLGSALTENFDTLASSGTSSATPNGWFFAESGTNANTTYAAGTGSDTGGNTYSFGASGNSERAFGGLQSGSLIPTIGAAFTNNSGYPIVTLNISYTGEMWRAGVANRGAADRIDFQYSLNATSLTDGSWTDVDSLDFLSPNINSPAGALDGNAANNRTAVNFSITGLSIPNGNTFWIRWASYDITPGSDDGLAVDDFSLTAIGPDVPPTVTSTTPANGATNVLLASNIEITFSEAVTVTGAWYSISCVTSGAHTAVVTGGPTVWTLNPDSDFVNSESCTVTLTAAQITDQDGTPDNMAADYIFSFQTVGPDAAPTVASTTPANGATGVARNANLAVTFSEPVDVAGSWVNLTCASSGVHSVVVSGGPTDFTLDPAVDFTLSESCTVTIYAAQVSDQDLIDPPNYLPSDYIWSFTVVDPDPAPTVTATVPANSAVNISLGANITITFSEAVDLASGWYGITCGTSGAHSAAVSGGPTVFTLNPDVNFVPGESCSVTLVAAKITDVDTVEPYDAMLADYTWSFSTYSATCADPSGTYPLKTIGEVQGEGTVSLYKDLKATVRGTVTGDYQTSAKLSGYFLQAVDDGNPLTSDAILVYSNTPDVNVGDAVQFSGTVVEYNGLTEIQIKSGSADPGGTLCGTPMALPAPVELTLPQATTTSFEPFEAQLVTITNTTLFVDQNYFQGRYGQLTLSTDSRMYNPTNGNGLGDTVDLNARRMIVLDDGSSAQNVNPVPYYDPAHPLRAGDTLTGGLTGFMDQGAINSTSPYILGYRVHATVAPTFNQVNLRPSAPMSSIRVDAGTVSVVGMNLYNYFTTIDASPYPVGSPYYYNSSSDYNTPRGADSSAELVRQTDKFVSLIHSLNPDIFGVDEMEKWEGADPADTHFLTAINTGLADPYAVISDPALGFGGDAIKNTIFYKPSRVTPVGPSVSYNIPDVTRPGYDLFDRYPIAQTFQLNGNGEIFTVIINHFKSKGCGGATGDELDLGQGCWNAKRVRQANTLLDFKNALISSTGDADVLFIGDYNAYGAEDPINVFTTAGMEDLMKRVPAETRYSYIFDGQSGYLDQAIATPSLSSKVQNIMPWHINADEPTFIDYDLNFNQPGYYTTEPYRASDHDPIWVKLNFPAFAVTDLDLWQTTTPALPTSWMQVPGSFASGFKLALDPAVPYYYLDTNSITSNRPLADGMYPFYFNTVPGTFMPYWIGRGVDGTPPYLEPEWMPTMWEIINGRSPVFYLKVVGTNYTLIDGLQYDASGGAVENPLRINGEYPLGAYTFRGDVADAFGYKNTVTVPIEFIAPLAVTDLDLWESINTTTWTAVPGSFATGFKMVLDPAVLGGYYYLDTNSITTNRSLADGMYPFYFNTVPGTFMPYWIGKGVDGTPPYPDPSWMPTMWEIINGRSPVFYLKVVGTTYTLIDGLQYDASGGTVENPLRINGEYPLGAYTFRGDVADAYGNTDTLMVPIEFIAPLAVTDLDLWQSSDADPTWLAVPGSFATGFKMALDPAVKDYYYLDTNSIIANRPLANGYYPFFVGTTPDGFFEYWAGRGVDGIEPYDYPWQPVMWEIINGKQPIFYLRVSSGPVAVNGFAYTLIDGLTKLMGGGDTPLRINSDYHLGAYTFTGEVADAYGNTDALIVPIEFIAPLAVTDLDLWQAVTIPAWTAVPGSYAAGFTMVLDPAVVPPDYYYLDTNSITVNRPLADVYHPFFVGTTPPGYLDYWDGRGVNEGATPGTWQAMMWEIINGRQPIFYLMVTGVPLGPVGNPYMLVDGLTKLMGGGDTPLRIEGSYLPGVYTFTGSLMDTYGYKDGVSVQITFNDLPKANNQSVSALEETGKAITLTAADLFPGTLNWSIVDQPLHGVLSGTAPNLTYTPELNYNGPDSFTFKVNDGTLESNVATVDITVTFVNDAPTLAGSIPDQKTTFKTLYTFTFSETLFTDLDLLYGDALTYTASLEDGSPLPAWLSFNPTTRTFSGVPVLEDVRTWEIKVTAKDLALASVSDTFKLQVIWVGFWPIITK